MRECEGDRGWSKPPTKSRPVGALPSSNKNMLPRYQGRERIVGPVSREHISGASGYYLPRKQTANVCNFCTTFFRPVAGYPNQDLPRDAQVRKTAGMQQAN